MKKILIYTLMIFTMSFGSCMEDFLDVVPVDQSTVDGWYQNESQIRATTSSLYGRPWFQFNDKFSWAAGDGLAGDMFQNYLDEGQLFYFTFNENNGIISQAWESLYNVISFSNAIIDDMPGTAADNGVSEVVINRGLGEARFMRGMAYYFLVEFWGEVPIIEKTSDLISSGTYLDIPKNNISSVYEFIRRDFEFAANNLAESDEPGRVTSWSAKGMLAKLHLILAQRGSTADFTIAANYASDVINNSGLSLFPNYEGLYKIENNNNQESLFALQWISGDWGTGNSRQAVFARSSRITGNPEAWGGGKCVTQNFIDNLESNAQGKTDLRRKAIYMQSGDTYPELMKAEGGYEYEIVAVDDEGTQIEFASALLNHLKKYVVGSFDDLGVGVANQATPLNQYMLRLSDVYLTYAEAILGNGTTTSDQSALDAVNAVRERAGLDPRTSLTFEDIFNERRVEFGIEGLNWLDVKRRWYRDNVEALDYLNSQERNAVYVRLPNTDGAPDDPNSYVLLGPGETFGSGVDQVQNTETPVVISQEDMYLPIPANEVVNNPLLGAAVEAVEYTFN